MSRRFEEFKEYMFNDWGLLRYIFMIYTLGIFYVLGSGFQKLETPSPEAIQLYGIERVSGYYGPGSWAAWLLTTAACCIDRLFRKPKVIDQTENTFRRSFAGLDINIIGVYGYPIIAGFDLLRRARPEFTTEGSTLEIGSLAASIVVLKMGSGLGVLLAGICLRRWAETGTEKTAAVFSTTAAFILFVMDIICDCIFANIAFRDAVMSFFLLSRAVTQPAPQTGLSALLLKSGLFDTDANFPILSSLLDGGDMNIVGMLVVYPSIVLCFFLFMHSRHRYSWRIPLYAFAGILAVHVIFFIMFTLVFFFSWFFPLYFWIFTAPPTTMASILDLDQLTFMLLGGALIIIGCVVNLIREHSGILEAVGKIRISGLVLVKRYICLNVRTRKQRGSVTVEQSIPLAPV